MLVFSCSFISALFLYFSGPSLLEMNSSRNFFPSFFPPFLRVSTPTSKSSTFQDSFHHSPTNTIPHRRQTCLSLATRLCTKLSHTQRATTSDFQKELILRWLGTHPWKWVVSHSRTESCTHLWVHFHTADIHKLNICSTVHCWAKRFSSRTS